MSDYTTEQRIADMKTLAARGYRGIRYDDMMSSAKAIAADPEVTITDSTDRVFPAELRERAIIGVLTAPYFRARMFDSIGEAVELGRQNKLKRAVVRATAISKANGVEPDAYASASDWDRRLMDIEYAYS